MNTNLNDPSCLIKTSHKDRRRLFPVIEVITFNLVDRMSKPKPKSESHPIISFVTQLLRDRAFLKN